MKLACIRRHEARWALRGYRWLFVEVILAVAYLGFVTLLALTTV